MTRRRTAGARRRRGAGAPYAARSDGAPRQAGRPVGADGDRTRERILEKAIETFAELGFAGASVRDLARQARIRVSSLYHYFPSKEALYEAVQERIHEQVRELTLSVMSKAADLRETTRQAVGGLFDFYVSHPAYVRLGHRLHLDGTDMRHASRRVVDRWLGLMEGIMKPAELQGVMKPIDAALFLITVDALLHWHLASDAFYRGFFGKGLDDPATAARVRDHLIQMVLRGVGLD